MNMDRDDHFLRTEYLKNLFPVMFSVLGGTINALIDSVFVSRRLGADALAAVNMSMPVYLVICTFGALRRGFCHVGTCSRERAFLLLDNRTGMRIMIL